ncbi:MAG: archease [Deltaproteobacteria bacterium]|nr:archease [Deltaproteobacteria bacterium]
MDYIFLNHTADIYICVSGETKERLFANAVLSMYDIMVEGKRRIEDIRKLKVDCINEEDALVDMLNEFLYLFYTCGFVCVECRVKVDEKLDIEASGYYFDKDKDRLKMEIKAATYEYLRIKKDDKWRANIVFDV